MKPCIVSFYMPNIEDIIVQKHKEVVEMMNPSKIEHVRMKCPMSMGDHHGDVMNTFFRLNEERDDMKFDVIVVLEIDCIPLSDKLLDYCVKRASEGKIIGNAQRSNHINNNQHVYVAPSLQAFTIETYNKIGRPDFMPTRRGDTSEELTYAAEANGVEIELFMPRGFEEGPAEAPKGWPLADGMPAYGLGTTYGNDEMGDLNWHRFQIRKPGSKERFIEKCDEVLNRK